MKFHLKLCFIASFILLIAIHSNCHAQSYAGRIIGTWQGRLFVRGDYIRLVFHFKENENKELTATCQSPDQGDKSFDVDEVAAKGDSLSLSIDQLGAEYDAIYNKDSAAYYGTYSQHGFKMKLKLIKGDADDLLYKRPQKPVKPYPYKEEEITVVNKKENLTLAGTFTRPFADGKYPVAILITGSGPQDRDETVFGHKPFLILSDYLTRHGMAVLRCDDRGTGKSTGSFGSATMEDFATDVDAQIDYLKTRSDVDVKRIGLIGHSEGGIIAPYVASQRNDVAFVVLMAGVGIKMFDLLPLQDSLIGLSEGMTDKQLEHAAEVNREVFKIVETAKDSAAAADGIDSVLTSLKMSDREIEKNIKVLLSPWMQSYAHYDPAIALSKLYCSVLAMNGEKDIQVPAVVNITAIKKAMDNRKNLTTVILPGLNHLFQHCTTCTTHEYSIIEETIDPAALNTIGDWMEKNVLKKQ